MSTETLYQEGNDNHRTPYWIKEALFSDWFDPCPLNGEILREFDGLGNWPNRTFLNPPYSDTGRWVDKALEENAKGKTVALLLKHDSSTKWWAKLHERGAHFLPIMGRLSFNGKPAPFPSVLVVLA